MEISAMGRVRRTTSTALLLTSLGLTAAQPASAEPTPASPYSFTVEPYGYLPWAHVDTNIRGFDSTTVLGPGQLLNLLEAGASARASAEVDRTGLLVDLAYYRLGNQLSQTGRRGLLTGTAELTSINSTYDFALRHRFGAREAATGQPGTWTVIPYAGARILQAQLDLAAQLRGPRGFGFEKVGSLDRTWTQPLLGTQASVFLTRDLRLFARGDIGGFGLAGARDLSGNAQVGLGYALGGNTAVNVSWRYLGIDWSNGNSRSTGFSSQQSGIEAGFNVFF
ncbi:MAG: hypothetical protein ACKO2F_07300 [Cyanobacteriota bacterium]